MGKHHSREYKEYVAKLVVDEGRKATEVAYELEISYKSVSRWVKAYREKLNPETNGEVRITLAELEEIKKQHAKELAQVKEENEILKKAVHIFTKSQN